MLFAPIKVLFPTDIPPHKTDPGATCTPLPNSQSWSTLALLLIIHPSPMIEFGPIFVFANIWDPLRIFAVLDTYADLWINFGNLKPFFFKKL